MAVMEHTAPDTTTAPAPVWRRRPSLSRILLVVAVATVLLAYPKVFPSSLSHTIGISALTFAIAATGWNLLGGYTGQLSFGHTLFFATGMYCTAVLVRGGWSPWMALLPSMALSAVLAVLVGLPCFRLRGHYFAIATLALVEIASAIVLERTWLNSGSGIELPLKDESLWNLQLSLRDKSAYYYVVLGMFAGVTLLAFLFVRGRTGRYIRAIRDDDRAAAAAGIPVRRYKLYAAAMSGAITSVAGVFQVSFLLYVDPPSSISLDISGQIALIAVLGGAGSLWGPVIGSWVLIFLKQYTNANFASSGHNIDLLVYGVLIVAIVIIEPLGIVGLLQRGEAFVRRRLPMLRTAPRQALAETDGSA